MYILYIYIIYVCKIQNFGGHFNVYEMEMFDNGIVG